MVNPSRLFSMTHPCGACPFLDSLPIVLAPGRAAEIAASIRRGEPFTCHKTIDYNVGDGETGDVNTDRARACVGAIATLEAGGNREQQLRQIARRLGMPVAEPAPDLPVFSDLDEWVAAMTERTAR